MKRLMLCGLIIVLICGFAACVRNNDYIDRFNIEAGKAAFIEASESIVPNSAIKIEVPEGVEPCSPELEAGALIVSVDSDEVDENFEPIPAYGIATLSGALLVECIYTKIARSGNFFMAELTKSGSVSNEDISYDFYYKDGTRLFGTENVISGFAAISEDYFALYTAQSSEVFYKDGSPLFGTNKQLSSAYCYSVCGDYLFAHEPANAIYFIFQIFQDSLTLIKSYVSGEARLYSVGYLGAGNFLVSTTEITDGGDYDYWNYIESNRYNYSQTNKIYNPRSGEKSLNGELIIAGIINKYTPSIVYSERKGYNLKDGYSAVLAIKTDTNKKYAGSECYVVNADALAVLKMPEGLTPFMLTYKDGLGFAGSAVAGYSAALFDYSAGAVWVRGETEYYAQSYGYGRYVLAKSVSGALRYGMLDSDGNTVVDFDLEFLSAFSGDYAIAKADGSYYRMNKSGERIAVIEDIRADNIQLAFSCYVYIESGKLGLKNFAGEVLVAAEYDETDYLGMASGQIFAIFVKDGIKDVYLIGG